MNYKIVNNQLIAPKSEKLDLALISIETGREITILNSSIDTIVFDNRKQACRIYDIAATQLSVEQIEAKRLAVEEEKQLQAAFLAEKIRLDRQKAALVQSGSVSLIIVDNTINKGAPSVKCLNGGFTTVKAVYHIHAGYLAFYESETDAIQASCDDLKLDSVSLHAALLYSTNHPDSTI